MLNIIKSGERACRGLTRRSVQKRSFLSDAYRCEEAWKARFQTPLLQKFKPEELFLTLDHKFVTAGKVSTVDIDIFANTIRKKDHVDELLVILKNLRKSAETTNTLDSTHHAVIRYLLDNDCTPELMNVLHDRLTYGIFPDHLTYNILMDSYIKRKDYASAAKVAVLPMLQEDTENPITNSLSLYACHKYLEDPDKWQKPPEPVEDSKEEIKIRVDFLRNPFFDDHFDLTDPRDLVGKTLAFQGNAVKGALGRSCQLRGLILYKKYKDASELVKQWLNGLEEDVVYEEVFNLIEKDKENVNEDEAGNEFKDLMSQIAELKQKSLCKESLTEALENNIKSAVEKQHDIDVNEQMQRYVKWEKQRESVLKKQTEDINRQSKLQEINKLKKYLDEKERLLTFFENEEQIELEIEKKEMQEKAEMERVLKLPRAQTKLKRLEQQEEYIPPRI